MSNCIRLAAAFALVLASSGCKRSAGPATQAEPASGTESTAAKSAAPVASAAAAATPAKTAANVLHIGYSDWPGFVAWEVAIQKGWFKEAGLDVEFNWFDYVPSMDAYNAGKICL